MSAAVRRTMSAAWWPAASATASEAATQPVLQARSPQDPQGMVQRRGRGALECVTRAGAKWQNADHTQRKRNPSQNPRRGKQTVANQMLRIVGCDLGIASRDLQTLPNHGVISQPINSSQSGATDNFGLTWDASRQQWQGRLVGFEFGLGLLCCLSAVVGCCALLVCYLLCCRVACACCSSAPLTGRRLPTKRMRPTAAKKQQKQAAAPTSKVCRKR